MIINKFIQYINIFGKKEKSGTANIDLKLMHGINRISIFMFLFAIIVMIIRALR